MVQWSRSTATGVTVMPGVPASTTIALMPARPAPGSVRAYTTPYRPSSAPVVHILCPLMRYRSPSRVAVVRIDRAGSDPPAGSLIAVNDGQACSIVGSTHPSIWALLPWQSTTGGSMPNTPAPGWGKLNACLAICSVTTTPSNTLSPPPP